jgi:oligopeptidase B
MESLNKISESVNEDSSNIVKYLPDIHLMLEEACLNGSETCLKVWNTIHPLLQELNEARIKDKLDNPILSSPRCSKRPVTTENVHGERSQDDFVWLKDKDDEEVLAYIKAENDYTNGVLENTKPLQKVLYKEFVSRLDEQQSSVHVLFPDNWTYYNRKVYLHIYKIRSPIKNISFIVVLIVKVSRKYILMKIFLLGLRSSNMNHSLK